jgi:positive regulator of sigma E activity
LENENIELHDERKEKFRDKSGRYAYLLGLVVISFSIVLFSVLGSLEIITNSKLIILYLGGYLVFQYIAGVVIFRHFNNRY